MSGKDRFKQLLKKKQLKEGADSQFEKGDFLAIVIAAASVFGPILLMAILALVLFILAWNAFF